MIGNTGGLRTNTLSTAGASDAVVAAVSSASQRTGVDFSYLMAKAAEESGYQPNAKASTSSATGLFQFTDSTWLQMVKQHGAAYGLSSQAAAITTNSDGHLTVSDPAVRQQILDLRKNPTVSADLAGEFTKDNAAALTQQWGGTVGNAELSLAHFLGSGGASKFLSAMKSDPSQPAAAVVPDAAAANQNVFYNSGGRAKSLAEVYGRFANGPNSSVLMHLASHGASAGSSGSGVAGGPSETNTTVSLAKVTAGTQQAAFTTLVLANLGTPLDTAAETQRLAQTSPTNGNSAWM